MRSLVKVVAVAAFGLWAAPAAMAETLADALSAAYLNSDLMAQNQALLRAADEDVAIAVSSLRPVVSYALQSTYSRSERFRSSTLSEGLNTSLSLSAELVLFDFGRRDLGIKIAEETVLATRKELISIEQQVLFDAVNAYVDVRLQQEIVALRQSNVRLITKELRAAEDRFEVGEITRTDVAIAEARLAAARANLAAAEGNLAVARESYKLAVGRYPGNLAALPKSPVIGKSLDEAIAVAMRTHPAVLQGQHLVKVADLQVESAKAGMKPSIGLEAGLSLSASDNLFRNGDDESMTQSLGVRMNQTIYAGGRLSAVYRKALAGKEAQRAQLHRTMAQVSSNVGDAWARLGVQVSSIQASDQQIRAAQTAFDGVREEATLGARTTLDVLDAEQELLNARASRLEAEAGRYVGVYQILGTMGLLTAQHLKLGVPTFDPESYYKAVRNAPATSSRGKKLDQILEKIGN